MSIQATVDSSIKNNSDPSVTISFNEEDRGYLNIMPLHTSCFTEYRERLVLFNIHFF